MLFMHLLFYNGRFHILGCKSIFIFLSIMCFATMYQSEELIEQPLFVTGAAENLENTMAAFKQ